MSLNSLAKHFPWNVLKQCAPSSNGSVVWRLHSRQLGLNSSFQAAMALWCGTCTADSDWHPMHSELIVLGAVQRLLFGRRATLMPDRLHCAVLAVVPLQARPQ